MGLFEDFAALAPALTYHDQDPGRPVDVQEYVEACSLVQHYERPEEIAVPEGELSARPFPAAGRADLGQFQDPGHADSFIAADVLHHRWVEDGWVAPERVADLEETLGLGSCAYVEYFPRATDALQPNEAPLLAAMDCIVYHYLFMLRGQHGGTARVHPVWTGMAVLRGGDPRAPRYACFVGPTGLDLDVYEWSELRLFDGTHPLVFVKPNTRAFWPVGQEDSVRVARSALLPGAEGLEEVVEVVEAASEGDEDALTDRIHEVLVGAVVGSGPAAPELAILASILCLVRWGFGGFDGDFLDAALCRNVARDAAKGIIAGVDLVQGEGGDGEDGEGEGDDVIVQGQRIDAERPDAGVPDVPPGEVPEAGEVCEDLYWIDRFEGVPRPRVDAWWRFAGYWGPARGPEPPPHPWTNPVKRQPLARMAALAVDPILRAERP